MFLRAFTAWIVTFNFRERRITTLFHCSSIFCYCSSRENRFTRRQKQSQLRRQFAAVSLVCQLHTLHYFSLFFPTKCILSGMLIRPIAFTFSIISKYFCLFFLLYFLFLLFWENLRADRCISWNLIKWE